MLTDVVIVGGGPTGLSVAATAARYGVRVVVVDEGPRPGGRLLGQLHEERGHGNVAWWNGREIAATLVEEARALGATILESTTVWSLSPSWTAYTSGRTSESIQASHVVIATGAAQRAIPFHGWTLPRVLTVGAVQTLIHVHRVRPGDRMAVIGANILGVLAARQLQLAGVEVSGVVLHPPVNESCFEETPASAVEELGRAARATLGGPVKLAGVLSQIIGGKLSSQLIPGGTVRVWGIPIMLRRAAVRILGESKVEGLEVMDVEPNGRPGQRRWTWQVDAVCVSDGLYPLAELPVAIGCPIIDVSELGGSIPLHGASYETPLDGVFVGGNITGIEGAPVAIAQGRIIGVALAKRLRKLAESEANGLLAQAQMELSSVRSTALPFLPRVSDGLKKMEACWNAHRS